MNIADHYPSRMGEPADWLGRNLVVYHGDHPGTTGRHFAESALRRGGRAIRRDSGEHLIAHDIGQVDSLLWVESRATSYPLDAWAIDGVSIGFLIDVHQHLRLSKVQALLFDVVFVAQKAYVDAVRTVHPNVSWLPLAAPRSFIGLEREPTFQVGFVGAINQCHSRRENMLKYANIHFAMNDWRRPHSVVEMADVYRRSRFVINPPIHNDLNMRTFEAMSAGAVLVTPRVPGLENIGNHGEHFVVADFQSAAGPTNAILNTIGREREHEISRAARAAIAEGHTYDHRIDSILDAIPPSAIQEAPIRSMSTAERGKLYMSLAVMHRDLQLAQYALRLSRRPSIALPVARGVVRVMSRLAGRPPQRDGRFTG